MEAVDQNFIDVAALKRYLDHYTSFHVELAKNLNNTGLEQDMGTRLAAFCKQLKVSSWQSS